MKDQVLFSITRVTDDDTGVWSIGELEYSIHVVALDDFLSEDPIKKRNQIFAMMGVLNVQIQQYAMDLVNKQPVQSEKRKEDR